MTRNHSILPLLLALAVACSPSKDISWTDRTLPPELRAADLLQQLTLEEKASLVLFDSPGIERLGIPAYNWWSEALHGVARNGAATTFPQPIGLAASFDPALTEAVFDAVSDEGRVKNRIAAQSGKVYRYSGLTFWTPNINIFRDPRWGRGMETYGEDPFLTGTMGSAVVRGLQGSPSAAVPKAHACAKHFAVHSGLESNRHRFDARVSERDLRETYLPAFRQLVTEAGVKEVMTAYNRFRGVPCSANTYLLDTILRGEWGYKGLVVSDCWAISDFYEPGRHDYSQTEAAAAAAAMSAGVDVECGTSYRSIPEAVRLGLLKEEDLDRNLLRALTERFRLGEIDRESPWDGLSPSIVEGPAHRALALDAARESLVLLRNDGVLPLKEGQRIALIGPNADDPKMQWGNYNPVPSSTVTLLQALRERIPGLVYERACGIMDAHFAPEASPFADYAGLDGGELEALAKKYAIGVEDIRTYIRRDEEQRASFLPELDEAAVLSRLEGIETVIFAGGISPRFEGEEMPVAVPGFAGGDRTDIELPGVQRRLLRALHDAGKKVILVNFSGCAMGLVPEQESCDAILQAWYPGQEGGTAVADVLLGTVNPSGRLPLTFYRDVSQLPDPENYDMQGRTYRYFRGEPLYPFGFGLSYTSFEFGTPVVRGRKVSVPVTNTGSVDGTQVVQLYVRRPDDPQGPRMTLRGFVRVDVPAGRTVRALIPLTDETFTWWDSHDMVPLHGRYELLVGSSSDEASLHVIEYKY